MNSANNSQELALSEDEPTILVLPDEALIHIIRYVDFPSRNDVGLVCQKFYELLCIVERDKHPLDISFSQISDDDVFDSVISSSREFNDLTINLKHCRVLSSINRIEAIMQKFGRRVKKFKLWCSVQSETSEISESQLVSVLNCLPNVEEIVLRNIYVSESYIREEEVNLHKLKSLLVDYCMFSRSLMLNKIPADVLHDLVFTFDSPDATQYQNFFNRQSKVKKLELFENDQIHFDHLQLEHLKISSSLDFARMLTQQPRLRYIDFAITWIDDDVFIELCKLKHLEVMKLLIDQVSCAAFRGMAELVKLKELRLDSHSSFDGGHLMELSMMKCLQLEKLTLLRTERKVSEEVLIAMSTNLQKLKHIELINRSIKIISTILEHFPNLESLLLDFFAVFGAPEDVLEISDDLRHANLKQLVITNVNVHELENTLSMQKLVAACPKLERIMLSSLQNFTEENLKEVLENHPNLTHLSLEFDGFSLSSEVISIIRRLGKNLVHLRLSGLDTFPSYSAIRILFEHQFPNITFYKYSTGDGEVIMKKRNVRDWYLDFRLMDHF